MDIWTAIFIGMGFAVVLALLLGEQAREAASKHLLRVRVCLAPVGAPEDAPGRDDRHAPIGRAARETHVDGKNFSHGPSSHAVGRRNTAIQGDCLP